MERKETQRLSEEAKIIIEQSFISQAEKDKLKDNVAYFLSIVRKEKYISGCKWEWFKDIDGLQGISLVWDWELAKGKYCIYPNDATAFSFVFGKGECDFCGGDDGKNGFYPDYDLDEIEMTLAQITQ